MNEVIFIYHRITALPFAPSRQHHSHNVARTGVDTWLVVIVYIQLFVHQLKQKQLFCNDTAPASVKVKEQALLKPRVFFRTYANSVFSKAKMRIQRLMVRMVCLLAQWKSLHGRAWARRSTSKAFLET